jgi:hypothetical protein
VLRFFDLPTTQWSTLTGCLHLYALPAAGDPIRSQFDDMAVVLADVPGLGLQPERFMHVTVQRLDAYEPDLADERWGRLLAALPEALREHSPFQATFAEPRARSHAIEAIGPVTPEWSSLLEHVRSVIAQCGLASALTMPPPAPHYSLAYSLAELDDELFEAALAPVARRSAFEIDSLALVAVDQDPDAGIFAFEPLSTWRLGG